MSETFRRLLGAGPPEAVASELVGELALRERAPADRPFVALNMISTLDGRITRDGRTGPLANRADHEMFHALRSAGDAVLVGAGTVRVEGYGAMDRLAVVVSRSLDLPPDLGLLRHAANRVLVVTDSDSELEPCAAQVGYLRQPRVDLGDALRRLRGEHGVRAVICEGGPRLNAALLPAGLVDELHLVIAPLLVGGADPLTLVEGDRIDPPLAGRPEWLLESGGYLFARYAL